MSKIIELDLNGNIISDVDEETKRIIKAELRRENFCCLNVACDCIGCGECNGRVI